MLYLSSVRVAPGVRSALAVACGVMSAGVGMAQEQSAVEPVVVTASRMPQLLQTAPIGATVITAEQIQRSGVADANEAIRKLGGVAARSDLSNGRESSLDLRGFGDTADQNLVVLIDGIRISENEMGTARLTSIPLDTIDHIEIVRGGASVLWGEGASSGAINIVLKRGAGEGFKGKLTGAVETYGGQDAEASGQWGFENTVLNASAKRLRNDGFRDNGAYAQDVYSVGAQWADKGWQARVGITQEDQEARLPGFTSNAAYRANRRVTSTPDDFANTHETRYLTSVSYNQAAWTWQVDMGQRSRDSSYLYFAPPATKSSRTQSQVSPHVTYANAFGRADVKVIGGLDWQGWDFDRPGFLGIETGSQENRAGYAQGEVSLPSQTRLSIGWREERVRKSGDFPGDGFNSAVKYQRSDKLHAGELGISQTVATGWDVYGRLASSYRLANVDENRVTPGNGALAPQKNSDKELGIKWSDGANSATARLFRQTTVDEIVYISPLMANANLDPTRRQGAEVEGHWSPMKELSLSGTWQQLTAKFRSGPNAGREMVLVAPHTATARASYRIDDRNSVELGMQYMAQMRTGSDADNACSGRVPSSLLWDGRYAWSDRVWTFSVSGTNLADKKGYNYDYSCDATGIYPYAGRSMKIAVSRQF